jgi:hypothetical protein
MKKFTILALALLAVFAGCVRDAPTEPQAELVAGPLLFQAPPEVIDGFVEVLQDITDRLLPSLTDQAIAAPLAADLQDLAAAMSSRNQGAARAALSSAMEVLENYQAQHGWDAPDAADLDGISLNLFTADALIGAED